MRQRPDGVWGFREYRESGWAVASVLLVISLTTTFFGWPECRYRMPLEPVMIVAATPLLLTIYRRVAARTLKMKTEA